MEEAIDGVGFRLDGATFCHVEGIAYNRDAATAQEYALSITPTTSDCLVEVKTAAPGTANVDGSLGSTNALILNGELYVGVVPTASLPSAGAPRSGRVLVENGGSTHRLVFYGGTQRFRVFGTSF